MRVLVVEDDGEMAETVATGLRQAGMAVDVALDGLDGTARTWAGRKPARLSVAGHRDVQSAPPPVLPAGSSPGSTVLPGTTRLPPAARVTSTRRARALGDAGMVTCSTLSA